ncbi:hypothetical protein [Bradyrhizobium sp. CCBAU 53340]|uniref:hypothetical protein n=1 Tax=Bradyrhizobium sp. CCBAU 53340 TaxID=1325112 RepID=UPI00188D4C68|nr:hypothetical protein [Bradyrhizobium sp. CCBAU 53340]
MPAYLVRLIDSRRIVGFFFVDHPDRLANSVQEWTDSDRCEYLKLPDGGIVWAGSAHAVPMSPGIETNGNWEIPELPLTSATMSESWLDVLYGYSPTLRWTKLKPSRQDSTPPQPPAPMGMGQVIPMRRPRP